MATRTLAIATAFTMLTPLALAQSNLPAPVESSQLRELDGWSVSALSRADGALTPDLWARSDPAFVSAVFARLPAVYDSPAMQALARRVLFSGGDAPRGATVEHVRGRFEALGKMGAADELATLAAGSGSTLTDPAVAMFAAQAELARGRRAEACQRGRGANAGETPPPFLLRLRAYCAAVTGDRAAADLALELARAQNAADNWYTGAVAAAAGAPSARPPAANYDNSLSAQLSVAGRLRPAANALNNSSTLALVALARNENTPRPQRAQAAALAFRRGAIGAGEARTILLATPAETTTGVPAAVTALRQVQTAPGS
ncbi:MAG TPA: hypothetical protein VEF55_09730, partial [Candidatus Binatia bacterium]|nr:hypothetical protein [Candidatus Binatia bacterium]